METSDLPICPLCDELYLPKNYKSDVEDICSKCEIHVDADFEKIQDTKENSLTNLTTREQ